MKLSKDVQANTVVRRGCLLLELILVLLYEHVSHNTQVVLLCLAGLTGIIATLSFLVIPKAVGLEAEAGNVEVESSSISLDASSLVDPADALAYLDVIRIPGTYREQWSALILQTKALRPISLQAYEKTVDLGNSFDWKAPELREIMKAVTSVNRRFSVELTNSDSILIHCEPVSMESRASSLPRPGGAASLAEMH